MKSFKQIVSNIRGEDILEEGKRGLWDNIHAKRERIKNGSGERMRKPGSEGAPTEKDLKNSQTNEEVQQLEEMPGANMDTRAVHQHLKRQGWKMTRTSGSHDVFTHDEAKHHIAVPRHRQLKAPLVKGILKQAQVHEEIEQLEEGLQQNLRKFVPGYAKKQINDKMDAGKFGKTDADKDANFHRYKKVMRKITTKEEVEQLEEGRPSQRHPLEGHEYHRKTDAELVYIAKDAHKAAEAMKSHNTAAENKYRDQANDSATVRYYRQKHGMADWYKKKYGHIKEEAEIEEVAEGWTKLPSGDYQNSHTGVRSSKPPVKKKRGEKTGAEWDAIEKAKKDKEFKQNVGKKDDNKLQKEEAEQINELSDKTLTSYAQKVHDDSLKHDKDPSKRSAEKRNKSVMGFSRAINKLEARPQNEEVEQVDEAMSASYRMALALKREKEKRENKDKAREARGDRFTTGPAQKPTPVQSHVTSESVNEQTASKLGQEREEVPFDKPYKTTKHTVTDKSGAKHTPMSRARDLARKAARKQAGLKEDSQIQDEVPQDKINTPAKQSLTKTAGIVKDLAKGKGKGKEGPDKFNPDPELSSEIQR